MNVVTQISHMSPSDLEQMIIGAVERHIHPLRRELEMWRQQAAQMKTVISVKDAVIVTGMKPATIRDEWVKHWGLPAFKRGQEWCVYYADLMAFLIGEIGFAQRSEAITIVRPTHSLTKHGPGRRMPSANAARPSRN